MPEGVGVLLLKRHHHLITETEQHQLTHTETHRAIHTCIYSNTNYVHLKVQTAVFLLVLSNYSFAFTIKVFVYIIYVFALCLFIMHI